MTDKRLPLGALPWTGGLKERTHSMFVADKDMSVATDVELGFDGRKMKRRAVRDVMGIIETAASADVAVNPG